MGRIAREEPLSRQSLSRWQEPVTPAARCGVASQMERNGIVTARQLLNLMVYDMIRHESNILPVYVVYRF
jgi:hypothetical protein